MFYGAVLLFAGLISCKKNHSENFSQVDNKPPIAIAKLDQTFTLPPGAVNLDGSSSTDPENKILLYEWTKISGPLSHKIADKNAVRTMVTSLSHGSYQFELKVTDIGGLFSKDTIEIIVNDPPGSQSVKSDAGPDQTITFPLDSTYLDGSGSSPNGWAPAPNSTYLWSMINGPSQTAINNATLQQTLGSSGYVPTTAIVKNLKPGSYLFRLQVTNSSGLSSADTVKITVVDDPQDKNTVTYHDLLWQAGDVYGLAEVDIFLTTPLRTDLFFNQQSYRPIEVSLKLDNSPSWLPVKDKGNDLYTFDETPLTLWIICFPNDTKLVGRKGSIKIKLL